MAFGQMTLELNNFPLSQYIVKNGMPAWHGFLSFWRMEEDKEKKHAVDKIVTPEPPQDMDPSKTPSSEKKAKQPSKDRAGKSRSKNEKRGNEEPKRKLLGESEITDETTI